MESDAHICTAANGLGIGITSGDQLSADTIAAADGLEVEIVRTRVDDSSYIGLTCEWDEDGRSVRAEDGGLGQRIVD